MSGREAGQSFLDPAVESATMSNSTHLATLKVFESLAPDDRVEVDHQMKVGARTWNTTTTGRVVRTEHRRHSLHFERNYDDKVFSDVIVLSRDDGELTTVTLDEFSVLRKIEEGKGATGGKRSPAG